MRRRTIPLTLFLMVFTAVAGAQDPDLIPRGASWRYLKGAQAPSAGWNSLGFDDSGWLEGPAGIGYGDGDDATVLADMQGSYWSIYARRVFQVQSTAGIDSLVLRISYDDGFIAYLNGVEVARRAMGNPGVAFDFDDASAASHEAAGFESIDITGGIPLLAAGSNVLAFQVHNATLDSSDLSFHPQLTPNVPIPAGPLPRNFEMATIAGGFISPTAIEFLPDGRMLVAEKRGRIHVVENGVRLPDPLLVIEDDVNNAGDRGLLGMVADPDFASNGYLYLQYVVDPVPGPPEEPAESISWGRLVRFRVDGNAADPASRQVLLGNTAADGFPHCHSSHVIGSLRFGLDGSLFAGAGDGAHFDFTDGGQDVTGFDPGCGATFGASQDTGALRSQLENTLAGKILRLDPATGLGLPDNPFYDGNPGSVASRIWLSGLRNPYRFTVRPGSPSPGTLYISDVGWNAWEELNIGRGGENFGWPCFEGLPRQGSYETQSATGPYCRGLSTGAVTAPLIAWHHSNAGSLGFIGNCATGIAFYTGTSYPRRYWNACFFADWGQNWIKVCWVDENDRLLAYEDFATGLQRPVDLQADPATGDLVYVSIQAGEVRRIRYTVGNRAPVIAAGAEPANGPAPLTVRFSSEGTVDPDGDPLSYAWDFGDGSPVDASPNPVHVYASGGTFLATLTVSDDRGGSASRSFTIETENRPPVVSIIGPATGYVFYGGETVRLRADASDAEDGEGVALAWTVNLIHEDHVHPEWFVSDEREPELELTSHGDSEEQFAYEIIATATDSGGLSASDRRQVPPGKIFRGDGNGDGEIDISDPVTVLLHLFTGSAVRCPLALDVDADGEVAVTDAIRLLEYIFLHGPAPEPPFPGCGVAANRSHIPCFEGCP